MILGADPGIEVVGQGDDGNEAVTLVQKHRPDVLLMDVRMPGLDGIAATTAVSALPNPPKIIMLTTFDMDEYVFQARSEEHTSELQSRGHLVCRLLLEKKQTLKQQQ